MAPRLTQLIVLVFGVIPAGVVAVTYGSFGVIMGFEALWEREVMGALFVIWPVAGLLGLIALVSASTRLGTQSFRLKPRELCGVICGFVASVPIIYMMLRGGVFQPRSLWIIMPMALSIGSAIWIVAASALNRSRAPNQPAEPPSPSRGRSS
jgi:hypothetical protein